MGRKRGIDFTNKVILEVGPGVLEHLQYNHTKPKKYYLADKNTNYLLVYRRSVLMALKWFDFKITAELLRVAKVWTEGNPQ